MPVLGPVITAITTAASIGATAYSAVAQRNAAKEQASYQQQIIEQERQAEAARKQAAELDARRRQLEFIRQQQRARASALAITTNQGASSGSALEGSYGQFSGAYNTGALGISQNLQLGNQLFDINSRISDARIGISQSQTSAANAASIASLGQTFANLAPTLGKFKFNLGNSSASGFDTYGGFVSGLGRGPIY